MQPSPVESSFLVVQRPSLTKEMSPDLDQHHHRLKDTSSLSFKVLTIALYRL